MAMEAAFIEVAQRYNVNFHLSGVTAPAVSALRSPDVIRDMLALGLTTMNKAAPGSLAEKTIESGDRLTVTLFDYAFEVAPRMEDDENTIDVGLLASHVEHLREKSDVAISEEFMTRIRQFAQLQINMEEMARKQAEPDAARTEETA